MPHQIKSSNAIISHYITSTCLAFVLLDNKPSNRIYIFKRSSALNICSINDRCSLKLTSYRTAKKKSAE